MAQDAGAGDAHVEAAAANPMWAAVFKTVESYRSQPFCMLLMYLSWLPAATRQPTQAVSAYMTAKLDVRRVPFVYFVLPPTTVDEFANAINPSWYKERWPASGSGSCI